MAVRSKYCFSGMRRRSGQQRPASVRAAAGGYQAPGDSLCRGTPACDIALNLLKEMPLCDKIISVDGHTVKKGWFLISSQAWRFGDSEIPGPG